MAACSVWPVCLLSHTLCAARCFITKLWRSFIFHWVQCGWRARFFLQLIFWPTAKKMLPLGQLLHTHMKCTNRKEKKNTHTKSNWIKSCLHFSFTLLLLSIRSCLLFVSFLLRFLYEFVSFGRPFPFIHASFFFLFFSSTLQWKRKRTNRKFKHFTKYYVIEMVNIEMSIRFRKHETVASWPMGWMKPLNSMAV